MYLSISFAGSRNLPDPIKTRDAMQLFFLNIESEVFAYFKSVNKNFSLHINLLNGLADGADMECADAFINWKSAHGSTKSLTGVFPFSKEFYLLTIKDQERFEQLTAKCKFLIYLDGRYLADGTDIISDISAREFRSRGYRQQSDYILSVCNHLFAVADPLTPGKAGGTLETIEKAKKLNIRTTMLNYRTMEFL